MTESDEVFLKTFRDDPEKAIRIMKIILVEREQDTVPSPAA